MGEPTPSGLYPAFTLAQLRSAMDMAFLQRAEGMLAARAPAPLDHALLLASLDARRGAVRPSGPPIDETIEGADDRASGWWWGLARVRFSRSCGCFNRAEAGRRFNAP